MFAVLPDRVVALHGCSELLGRVGRPDLRLEHQRRVGFRAGRGAAEPLRREGLVPVLHVPEPGPAVARQDRLKAKKVGLLAYNGRRSRPTAPRASRRRSRSTRRRRSRSSTPASSFGVTDVSGQVSEMMDKGVDLVTTCMDNNGVADGGQGDEEAGPRRRSSTCRTRTTTSFIEENAQFFQGSYTITFFTPFEVKHKPKGLRGLPEVDEAGPASSRTSTRWPVGSTPTSSTRVSRRPGPDFTRQKVIDAINSMTDYTAGGAPRGVDWQIAHSQEAPRAGASSTRRSTNGKFVPSFGQRRQAVRLPPGEPAARQAADEAHPQRRGSRLGRCREP